MPLEKKLLSPKVFRLFATGESIVAHWVPIAWEGSLQGDSPIHSELLVLVSILAVFSFLVENPDPSLLEQ